MTPTYAQLMARYNRWMNGKLYGACADLGPDELERDRGAFFGSLFGTLNHLLVADLAWLGRFKEGTPRVSSMQVRPYPDFAALWTARRALDAEIVAWAGALTDAWLAAPLTFRSLIDGGERTSEAWRLVVHFFNHQTHHRGQATTLLTQLGRDIGATDLPLTPSDTDKGE